MENVAMQMWHLLLRGRVCRLLPVDAGDRRA